MLNKVQVLDHGYVAGVEHWGSDERIIEAARMSTQRGFEGWGPTCPNCDGPIESGQIEGMGGEYDGWVCKACKVAVDPKPGDEKLLAYLWKNEHSTPFEMAGAVFEIQAPIFVFREHHRHRTQSYSERSARYAALPEIDYVPTVERVMLGGGHLTKQAGAAAGAKTLTEPNARAFRSALAEHYEESQKLYEWALDIGVPKELARCALTVGRYSCMRASANLRNWLGFLKLRMAPQAQYEIRQFAEEIHRQLSAIFPRTLKLFDASR